MKDRYTISKPHEIVSRRDVLKYLLTGGALAALQGLFKIPFVGEILESEKEAAADRPKDGDLTLYRINPVKAETQGNEYVKPFEDLFIPELASLSEQRKSILANINKLDTAWTLQYYDSEDGDSEDGWLEPNGMSGYHNVINKMKVAFQNSTI